MAGVITAENLGAWLIKCDPKTWDFIGFVNDGGTYISEWSVVDNRRSKAMRTNDPILFWKSGNQPGYPRGIWGVGYVTGEAYDVVEEVDDEPGYWLDETARLKVTHTVPVHIPLLLDAPVTDAELRAAGIDDLEVQRVPGGSNPSWVTAEQLARINELLDGWPEPPDIVDELTVSDRGAGFGRPEQNKAVEHAAMTAVVARYRKEGWEVTDVSAEKLGWDLTCAHPDGTTVKVEVKGVSGNRPTVLLTANEIRAARAEPDWVLVVVTRALVDKREIIEFGRDRVLAAATPYVYRAELAPADAPALGDDDLSQLASR